jgi:hypothetical protein
VSDDEEERKKKAVHIQGGEWQVQKAKGARAGLGCATTHLAAAAPAPFTPFTWPVQGLHPKGAAPSVFTWAYNYIILRLG